MVGIPIVNHVLKHVVDVLKVALKFSLVLGQLSLNSGEGILDIGGSSLLFDEAGFDIGDISFDGVDMLYMPLQRVIEDLSDRHSSVTARKSILKESAIDMVIKVDFTYTGLLEGHPVSVTEMASRLV